MTDLGQVFLATARAYPDKPALWVDGSLHSYAQLLDAAQRIAWAVLARDDDAPVAVLAQRSLPAYAGILGAVLAGKTFVPLNPRFPLDRNTAIADAGGVGAIVADAQTLDAAIAIQGAAKAPLLVVAPDVARADVPAGATRLVAKDDLAAMTERTRRGASDIAYIMFTSGTTGAPKGVRVTNINVLRYLKTMRDMLGLSPADRCTQLFDFSFDLSVHDLFVTWNSGASLYVLPKDANLAAVEFVRTHALTAWFSVPAAAAMARRLRQLRAGAMPSLRYSLFCGEALPIATAKAWADAAPNARLLNLYGPTEATIAITAFEYVKDADLGDARTMPIGTAYAEQEAIVAGSDGNELPVGEAGELLLGGSQVSAGYLNNAQANREKFLERSFAGRTATRWYRTGDLCAADAKLGLIFLGRIDDQLKINGHRVELMEVEAMLRRVCSSDVAAAVPWPLDENGAVQGLVAFACPPVPGEQEILSAMAAQLPPYMVPKRVHMIETMPLSTSGKIDRKSLRALCEAADKPVRRA